MKFIKHMTKTELKHLLAGKLRANYLQQVKKSCRQSQKETTLPFEV